MKIAIEAQVLADTKKTGVGSYTERLLIKTIGANKSHNYSLVSFKASPSLDRWKKDKNVDIRIIRWFPRKLYNAMLRTPFGVPIDVIANTSSDLFIFPAFARWPLARTKKSIIFVYDVSYIDTPSSLKTSSFQRYLSNVVPKSICKSDLVVTISEFTKKRIVELYNIPIEKIRVINPGIESDVFKPLPSTEIKEVINKYGVNKKYILYTGTLEPRKNIAGIIRAYRALPDSLKNEYQLVLAGSTGWKNKELEKEESMISPKYLIKTGYIDEKDLPALYSGASLFVFPSFYEGWGMPVQEAMACGVPVITANNSSLPEAGGNAAHYIDAEKPATITAAMVKILNDPKLAQEMREKGIIYTKKFTWEKSAKQLSEAIETVMGERN